MYGAQSLSHVQFFAISWTVAPPGSSVPGILQARILEWVVISFSRGFPNPGIEPISSASPELAGRFFITEPPEKPLLNKSASLVAQRLKRLPAMWETQVRSLGQEKPLEKEWQPTPLFLPGEFRGQRGLVSYGVTVGHN